MKIINRDLSPEKDGIPGYIAHPDRKEPGPGVLDRAPPLWGYRKYEGQRL